MLRAGLYLVSNILVILVLSFILPGLQVEGAFAATVFILLLTLLNLTVVPILQLFTLPINLITLGLSGFIINFLVTVLLVAVLEGITLTGSILEQGVTVIILMIVMSITNTLVNQFLEK
jgi:putative membrane protein